MDEKQLLRGNILSHPSLATSHDYPAFLRAAACRVVAGSMLLSGVFTALCAITTDHDNSRASCGIATAVSLVAFYHYLKVVAVRDQTGSRVVLGKPGEDEPSVDKGLVLGWQDMLVDSIRYSDWLVTLPGLVIELHLLAPEPPWFGVPWAAFLVALMVVLGAFTRFGTDELVPVRTDLKRTMADGFARLSGLLSFVLAFVSLVLVLYNLLANVHAERVDNAWIMAFSLPWIAYGVVAIVAMVVRQFYPAGYPETLSLFKDVSFGALDVWSKAVFGFFVGAKSLGLTDPLFKF